MSNQRGKQLNKYVPDYVLYDLETTGISATDKEQFGAITIYKEGEVLSSWNGSNFTYEKKKLSGAAFKVTAGADIYKADGTKVYNAGDVVAEQRQR